MVFNRHSSCAQALIFAASIGTIAFSSQLAPGNAAALDTARMDITGTIPATCAFTTKPASTTLGDLVSGSQVSLGSFGFTCNLQASGAVNLTVQSTNGALKRSGGTETVAYQVIWSIQGNPNASGDAASWVAPYPFTLVSGASGAEQLGAYAVRIVGPTTGLIAGDYKDTITYTISP